MPSTRTTLFWLPAAITLLPVVTYSQIADSAPDVVAGIQVNYTEAKAGEYTLPDALRMNNGQRVSDKGAWVTKRRPEIRKLIEENWFGRAPGRPREMTFEVVERRTGSLTLGAAVGGGTGLSGFLGYEQPNLFGQAKSGRVRWEFGSRNNNLELGYTEPVLLGTKTSMSTSFFDIDQRYSGTTFRQEALGGNVRFGTPLPWDEASRLFYGYTWQRIDLEATDGDDERFEDEYPRTESSVSLSLVRDTRLDAEADAGQRQRIEQQWRAHAPALQVWHGPGNHITVLRPPNVAALVDGWRAMLRGSALPPPPLIQ